MTVLSELHCCVAILLESQILQVMCTHAEPLVCVYFHSVFTDVFVEGEVRLYLVLSNVVFCLNRLPPHPMDAQLSESIRQLRQKIEL